MAGAGPQQGPGVGRGDRLEEEGQEEVSIKKQVLCILHCGGIEPILYSDYKQYSLQMVTQSIVRNCNLYCKAAYFSSKRSGGK